MVIARVAKCHSTILTVTSASSVCCQLAQTIDSLANQMKRKEILLLSERASFPSHHSVTGRSLSSCRPKTDGPVRAETIEQMFCTPLCCI